MESLLDPSLDDFFNLDALSVPPHPALSASGSQSSASPRSPFPFQSMPLTPPPLFSSAPIQQPSNLDDSFFNFFMEDDFSKAPAFPPPVSPYDFLVTPASSGINLSTATTTSISPDASSSRTSPTSYTNSPQPSFGIDPQLVGTPGTSRALSDFDEEEYLSTSHIPLEEEEEREEDSPSTSTKSTARGKVSRKGTVISGGVKKATDKENTNKSKKDPDAPLKILEPEDWRPSPEEYKKMSSKEKRQLRNKISARNFRVRRKEYITTLEGDIADRDRLIDAIRSELGSSRSENVALRQEIAALKKCLLEGRDLPDLPPPAELPPSPASPAIPTASTSNVAAGASSSIITPNTQKDLPTSPRLGTRAFWGGFGGMGVTPVHTAFIPPIAVLASKASSASNSPILQPSIFYEETIRPRVLQENINPGLNSTAQRNLIEKKGSANINPNLSQLGSMGAFDAFTDTNPFTFRSLDAYRMQLWGKMAAQQHVHTHQTHTSPPLESSGLASGLRPHFFTGPTKVGAIPQTSAVGIGAGVRSSPSSSTPPTQSSLSNSTAGPTREQAVIAALASQTLLGKLGQAFWDAFSGSSSASSSSHLTPTSAAMGKQWDADKVRKILEGRAVLRVVDVEPPQHVASSATLQVSSAQKDKSKSGGHHCALTDILEESMRSLTLGKKMN